MLVKLPRKVSGRELIEAIEKTTQKLVNVCKTELKKKYCYVPGSVKMQVHKCKFSMSPKVLRQRGIFQKRIERVTIGTHFNIPELNADDDYQDINIGIGRVVSDSSFGTWWHEHAPGDKTFEEIRPIFEEFLERLYQNLGALQPA